MAGFREREKQHFPLQEIKDVVGLFKDQLADTDAINLSLLSVVLGTIENSLTVNRGLSSGQETGGLSPIFPVVDWDTVNALYTKFATLVKSSIDLSQYPDKFATRELVKKVSDVVWGSLTRAFYKDKAHLQSLFSFLTGNKLDCFGVAFAVVAAFQVLGYDDVHLALSEDHAWVVFGEDLKQSAEVTWHGKGNEDKRGQPIDSGVSVKRWLYLNGQPVVCSRQMEVAAIVSGVNPSITVSTDSVELGSLQQQLLWLLYDLGHLSRYPMALGNLGDLEEISPTPGRPPPVAIFEEAVQSAKDNYSNMHVYPYTYLGGHLYRTHNFRGALKAWAQATAVIKKYNYNREDEEIYKEFLEIANDWIPTMMKVVAGDNASRARRTSMLYDTEAFADFLAFYDGICEWEEDSPTPVLHITWAKQLAFSLGKFDAKVRKCIELHAEGEEDEDSSEEESSEDEKEEKHAEDHSQTDEHRDRNGLGKETKCVSKGRRGRKSRKAHAETNGQVESEDEQKGVTNSSTPHVNGNNDEEQIKSAIEELVSKVGGEDSQPEAPNPNLAALAQACGDSILNPDYLLTGGEPFAASTASAVTTVMTSTCDSRVDVNEFLSTKSNGTPFMGMTVDSMLKAESPADMMMFRKELDNGMTSDRASDCNMDEERVAASETKKEEAEEEEVEPKPDSPLPVSMSLISQKMKGLRKLLSSAKLNTSAIMLQLTAQSQVHFKHAKRGSEVNYALPRKRTRRD